MKTEIPFFHMHEIMSAIVKKFLDHTTLMPDESQHYDGIFINGFEHSRLSLAIMTLSKL